MTFLAAHLAFGQVTQLYVLGGHNAPQMLQLFSFTGLAEVLEGKLEILQCLDWHHFVWPTHTLTDTHTHSGRKLEKSVGTDSRTFKLSM